jgi:hypothetical protein
VDNTNTGEIHENMVWQNQLTQFLQIDHQLKVDSEALTTSFLSGLAFFERYIKRDANGRVVETNIVGMTGTLGTPSTIHFLAQLYPMNVAFIPPHKPSKYRDEGVHIVENEEALLARIVRRVCIPKT